eukprot:6116872-Alexandrium_andersonii.AAC.1
MLHQGRPVHLGIDNQVVVSKLRRLANGWRPPKSWQLYKDGDVWARISDLLDARGGACRASKLKAHCSQQDVIDGKISARDR